MLPVVPSTRCRTSAPAGERASGVEGKERVCIENLRVPTGMIPPVHPGSPWPSGDIPAPWPSSWHVSPWDRLLALGARLTLTLLYPARRMQSRHDRHALGVWGR